jgi:hypothetical protein
MPQEFSRLARSFLALAGLMVLAACGGGGGGSVDTGVDTPGNPGPGNPGGPGNPQTVTISGRVTFDRLVFQSTVGNGLDAANPVVSPAREVLVQAISNGNTLASTSTDADGNYSLSVPINTNLTIRASARLQKTGSLPTWDFTVRNNTNSDAVYAMQLDSFNSGTADQVRDLHAPSGWSGTRYTSTRVAAPFAIIDTVYNVKQLILSAAPTEKLPPLNLFWSPENRPSGRLCADSGDVVTTFYFRDPTGQAVDDCGRALPDGIYILGDFANGNGDTDEFDAHVIAHEMGHYFEDQFSRSDSIGGEHGPADLLDMRLAFGEGWGHAFGAMALNDPQYRDSSQGVRQDTGFNLESGTGARGWFSELSVAKVLWDIFDDTAESGDNVALGFTPIYRAMIGPQVTTDALTSIFSFAEALRAQSGVSSAAIGDLLRAEGINGTDEFGEDEDNDGGIDPGALRVYERVVLNARPTYVCTSALAGTPNKLGNNRFLVFDNEAARPLQILAQGVALNPSQAPASDPEILVYRRGIVLAAGSAEGSAETVNITLDRGRYVIEVYDDDLAGSQPRCMNVSVTGAP